LLYNANMKLFQKHKNDILLILAVLLLAGGLWLWLVCTRTAGGTAVVTVDGVTIAELPLDRDAVLAVTPGDGFAADSTFCNTVEVSAGRARVVEANCPDKICEDTGWVQYDGQMIVCLPHKLIVTVAGGEAGADATAQ